MTIGTELDQAFYNLGQRITRLEKKEVAYPVENDFGGRIDRLTAELNDCIDTVAAFERQVDNLSDLSSTVEGLEAELNDRIDELQNFDPDDLRCDFESGIEDVRDSVSYMDDRIDDIECYKITEDEARDIAIDVCREEISDVIGDFVESAVCSEVNSRAVGYTEWTMLVDRVKELEDRLNKPSFTARALRWLREGPSIKEVATNWYAGIRRGS